MMTKKRKIGVLVALCSAFALLFTMTFAISNKKGANAYFKRISISKAVISLSGTSYDWTGKAIKPGVTVKYNGANLKKDTDYTVTYKNNTDAGVASVVVKGIGNYRGSKTLKFTIVGIDIEKDCTYRLNGTSVYVYYKDTLVDPSNYTITSYDTKSPTYRYGDYQEYMVVTTYVVSGKGQYSGSFSYKTSKTVMIYEPIIENDNN